MHIARFPRLYAESEDFLHLDFLRIIAALGVVFHWRASVTLPGPIERWNFIDQLSSFVDMFFVISGFIICHVYARRMETISAFMFFAQALCAVGAASLFDAGDLRHHWIGRTCGRHSLVRAAQIRHGLHRPKSAFCALARHVSRSIFQFPKLVDQHGDGMLFVGPSFVVASSD